MNPELRYIVDRTLKELGAALPCPDLRVMSGCGTRLSSGDAFMGILGDNRTVRRRIQQRHTEAAPDLDGLAADRG